MALLPRQPRATEGAGSVESMGAVRQRDLAPAHHSLLRADVAAGAEGVGGRPGIQVQSPLAAQPQWHVGAHPAAHGALPLAGARGRRTTRAGGAFVLAVAPVVVAVHMAAVDVDPGLLLVHNLTLGQAGEGQRVEAHRTLRPCSVQLLSQRLQLLEGRSMAEPAGGPPEQGGTAQVDERAILESVGLIFNLDKEKSREEQ